MTQLEATLDDIVGKLRDNRFPNEQSVSQGVVLRVLGDLNWDVYDTDIVWPEYRTREGRRVDFALCHPAKQPLVVVEVKQPGGAEGGVEQAMLYAFQEGIPYVVLTDGRTWSFYLPGQQGDYEERRVLMLDLLQKSSGDSAAALQRYLERNGVVSGEVLRVAHEEYRNRRRRANACRQIPNTWKGLVDKHDRSLIGLLADSVEAKAGTRPDDTDIIGFLTSLRQRSSGRGTNIAESPPTSADTLNVTTRRDDVLPVNDVIPATKTRFRRSKRWSGRTIRSTRTKNPRRVNSKGWHAHNFIMSNPDGVSYEDYRAAGYTANHLKWDLDHGHITAEYNDRNVIKR